MKDIKLLLTSAVIAAFMGLQAWTLHEVVNLKVSVAELSARVTTLSPPNQSTKAIALK